MVPGYPNLGPFRLPKNPKRLAGPPVAEFQQVLHSNEEGAERERQCSPGRAPCGAWDVSDGTRKRRSILALPSPYPSGSYPSSWLPVLDITQERAEELSLSSSSIYGALGGLRSKARDYLPGIASGSSAQSLKTMRGRLKNNLLMPINDGAQSIRSGCTSSHTAVASNGPLGIQNGLLGSRMEQDGSSSCVVGSSGLGFGSGQSLKNIRDRIREYIGTDKCGFCQEDWVLGRSPVVAKSRNDRNPILARLPCGHWFHRVCLAVCFSQISLAATKL